MKSQPITRLLAILAVISFSIGSAQAVTIASWDTTGAPGNQTSTSGVGSAFVSASDLVRGDGLATETGVNSFNSKGWTGGDDDYIEFGFVVESGYSVALDTLFIGTRSSNTGPGMMGVYTSLDGFTAAAHIIEQEGDDFAYSEIDLSPLGSVAGAFTIRLIEVGSTQADGVGTTSSTGTFRVADYSDGSTFSDIRFTGTVSSLSVPDGGATFVLLGLGLCSLLGARRKLA